MSEQGTKPIIKGQGIVPVTVSASTRLALALVAWDRQRQDHDKPLGGTELIVTKPVLLLSVTAAPSCSAPRNAIALDCHQNVLIASAFKF